MRKIRLSDTDLELFDIEISLSDFTFYQKHKDAFRTMWKEQVSIPLPDKILGLSKLKAFADNKSNVT